MHLASQKYIHAIANKKFQINKDNKRALNVNTLNTLQTYRNIYTQNITRRFIPFIFISNLFTHLGWGGGSESQAVAKFADLRTQLYFLSRMSSAHKADYKSQWLTTNLCG